MTDLCIKSLPAHYATLWPPRHFGGNLAAACVAAGVRSTAQRVVMRGTFAAVAPGAVPLRLAARTIEHARMEIIAKRLPIGTAIYAGLYHGRSDVWVRVEEIATDGDAILGPFGVAVAKARNATNPFDMVGLVKKLASGLRTIDREYARPKLQEYFDRLRVDWNKLTTAQVDQVINDAHAFLRTLRIDPLIGLWERRMTVILENVATKTRQTIRKLFLPSVQLSLDLPEREAIAQMSRQAGWFVRDEYGRRSKAITRRSRKIVVDGLRNGLGRDQIARELMASGSGYWDKRGFNYARVVAANGVSRARSHAEITGYRQVGIEQLEVQAVLDERTTEICRTLDGTIINVSDAWELEQEITSIRNPEDIYTVAPFLRTVTDEETGERQVLTGTGKVMATITRSGVGNVDDR